MQAILHRNGIAAATTDVRVFCAEYPTALETYVNVSWSEREIRFPHTDCTGEVSRQ